jgi:putative transposase
MKSRYSYRIYPTDKQIVALSQLFGCCRVVFNDAVALCKEKYSQGEKKPTNSQLSKHLITEAKKTEEREWLKDVSAIPLQQSLRDFDQAFSNFFQSCQGQRQGQKVKPPKFKSKHSRQTARFTNNGFKVNQHNVYLAKIGNVKIVWSRPLPSKPSSVTVIKDSANRYFLSFVVETISEKLADNGKSVGIDLGITDFATFSNGEKVKAPKPLKKKLKRLRKLQRNLGRKKKGSNRRGVARKRLAKLHAKVKDTRTDFLHKLSTKTIRENQTIVLEDLNVSGMLKNRKLSRAISDLGWREFRTMLEGKAIIYGRDFRIINRWTPTSQTCSACGFNGGKKDLSIRGWSCLNCGAEHDRDVNAAVNIKLAGGQSESINGCGGRRKTTKLVAVAKEASTTYKQLSLF